MAKKSIPTVAAEIFDLLKPLKSAERRKAVAGAMAMLGEIASDSQDAVHGEEKRAGSTHGPKGSRAKRWMSTNSLTEDQVSQVFHRNEDGSFDVLETWGTTNKERTINAYLLLGVSRLLANDEPAFSDADAVGVCNRLGCYDMTNHAKNRKALGKRVSGNKSSGYTLTVPGLNEAAGIVKQVAGGP